MGDWISASIYLRIPSLRRYETRERLPPSRYCAVPPTASGRYGRWH